jgi:hypothetical protein
VLADYFAQVEREVPLLCLFVFYGSLFPEFIAKALVLRDRLLKASRGRGETRASALRELADYLEVTYKEMVSVFYEIERVRSGEVIPKTDFGNMLDSLMSWTKTSLPGFLDGDAARFRNAAHHYHFEFDETSGVVSMHNGGKKGVSWRKAMTMLELYRYLRKLHSDVEVFVGVIAAHIGDAFLDQLQLIRPSSIEDGLEQLRVALPQLTKRVFEPVLMKMQASKWVSHRAAAAPPALVHRGASNGRRNRATASRPRCSRHEHRYRNLDVGRSRPSGSCLEAGAAIGVRIPTSKSSRLLVTCQRAHAREDARARFVFTGYDDRKISRRCRSSTMPPSIERRSDVRYRAHPSARLISRASSRSEARVGTITR